MQLSSKQETFSNWANYYVYFTKELSNGINNIYRKLGDKKNHGANNYIRTQRTGYAMQEILLFFPHFPFLHMIKIYEIYHCFNKLYPIEMGAF